MSLRPVLRFLGRLVLFLAAAQLVPAACAVLYGETADAGAFLGSAAVTALAGGVMVMAGRGNGDIYRREGILIVVGGWVLASLFGALPYLLTDTLASPVDALFEAASGFTTTGATVLTDIEAAGRGVLFWRSFTQWLGGMGIIVLFVALLPELGPGARFLYKLEVPGPTAQALLPHIRDTATVLWRLYVSFTAAETALLMLAGLDLYDALTHTFSTLSTGGFSPRAASVAAFASPAVDLIVIVFMVLAGANFSLYFGLRHRSGWRTVWRDPELRAYLAILAAATLAVAGALVASDLYPRTGTGPARALLDSLFQVTSILTTTGFATVDFETWPAFARMALVALMFVGGCAGSTAGSMKVMRMVIGLKAAWREVRLIFSPSTVISILVGKKPVPEGVVRSVAGFFILYLSSWGLGTVALTLVSGQELVTAATAAAATLGNIGPGLEAVGPIDSYAFFDPVSKVLMVLLMWLGRLEVYSIAALVTVRFWRP
ncbi:MAG TPA: TrkH family potassium uptake protein [Thermoanaerobaculia bacterium]|nr:TrkH family potassium uptake protein [Thermoanaerobaculia bacterium]